MLQTLPCCRATIRPISPRRQDLRYDEGPFLRRLPEHILQKPKDSQPANLPRHAVASYDCPKSRLTSARTAVECILPPLRLFWPEDDAPLSSAPQSRPPLPLILAPASTGQLVVLLRFWPPSMTAALRAGAASDHTNASNPTRTAYPFLS